MPSLKYGISPENIESKSLNSERFKTLFNMHRIEKTSKLNDRLDRYDKKIYQRKRIKSRENLKVGKESTFQQKESRKKVLQENFINNLYRILVILIKKQFILLEKNKKQMK